MAISIKTEKEIAIMREASDILIETHKYMAKHMKVGITTRELNNLADSFIRSNKAVPSFKGLYGYPASACISINEEVVHGLPTQRKLKNGDIVSIDMGVFYKGYHSDAARTHAIGNVAPETLELIKVTKQSFFEAMKFARAGNHLGQISQAIQDYCESHGYGVVRDLVGHGIGKKVHEDPQIPNYKPKGRGVLLEPGMTFAIEPMINLGTWQVYVMSDNWTYVTRDGLPSAHYENTIVITDADPLILTLEPEERL
ncbi:MAG: type I methionyl aminopeptidase [Candidatus Epulonipiscioides saccharophilum]|nr:MAG: type I methionyl aminopeptidase [Epulopiscium sp. AS2M-Bin001]